MSFPEGDVFLRSGAIPGEDVKLYPHGYIAIIIKEVLDGLGLSEVVDVHKLREVFDVASLSEAVFTHRTIPVSDSTSLSDMPFRDWVPLVLDVITSSDRPLAHRQALVTDLIGIIEELPSISEKVMFVADVLGVLESFFDVWKGKWDEPIQELYQSLRELKVKLAERKLTLKVKGEADSYE